MVDLLDVDVFMSKAKVNGKVRANEISIVVNNPLYTPFIPIILGLLRHYPAM